MKLQECFNEFKISKELRGCKVSTLNDYTYHLLHFINYIGPDRDITELSREMLKKYCLRIVRSKYAKGTKSTYIRNLKIFIKYLNREGYCSIPSDQVESVKMPKKDILIYTDDQVQEIFEKAVSSFDWMTYRNKAIIALMYDCGLRQSEVSSLTVQHINFQNREILVDGKGDKQRIAILGDITKRFMDAYMYACPYKITDTFFLEVDGKPMTSNAIKLFVQRMKEKLDFPFSSHKLRHNFATNWCIDEYDNHGSMDISMLQYLMGHESAETTKRYLHFAMERIAAKNKVSHLDKMSTIKRT